jgi:hypothetical protein
MQLANALLGAALVEALMCEQLGVTNEHSSSAV